MALDQQTVKNGKNTQAFEAQKGRGRPKGVQNKITKQVKEMILGALDDAGGQAYLTQQARDNPTAFMTLVGKVLPLQLSGEDGGPVQITTVKWID